MDECELDGLFEHCKRIFDQTTEIGFRAATHRLLPIHQRRHVYAIFAFLRTGDDIIDEDRIPQADKPREFANFRVAFLDAVRAGHSDDPLLKPLLLTLRETGMELSIFDRYFRSMELDLTKHRYETFEEILDYADGSAVAVGHLLMYIWGVPRLIERFRLRIRDYCVATQMINIVCDVREDLAKGRVYLPQEELREHRVIIPPEPGADAEWIKLMSFQVSRIRRLLKRGAALEPHLPEEARRWLNATTMSFLLVLKNLERSKFEVFVRSLSVIPMSDKLRWYRAAFKEDRRRHARGPER